MPSTPSFCAEDPVFDRPVLGQTFRGPKSSEPFIFMVADFQTRDCNGATGLNLDQKDGQACYNNKRISQAHRLRKYAKRMAHTFSADKVVITGDFNAFAEEGPMNILRANDYLAFNDQYNIAEGGLCGQTGHFVVTSNYQQSIIETIAWHIIADEPSFIHYNRENEQQGT